MRRTFAWGLFALVAVQVAAVLFWVRPGPLSIDEIIYQWMARSVAEGHGLAIANAYEELPSQELATTAFMYARDGELTAQYPYYFPWLAAPFYAVLGFLGLFLVNALAYVGVVALTYRIGWRLLGDRTVALLGTAVLAVGSFAWEYSMGAWPHMATLLTQVGAFALMLEALLGDAGPAAEAEARGGMAREAEGRRGGWRRAWAAAGAGFVLAVGVGFRRDAIFFLPVLALPLLYHRPVRGRELGALFLGSVPPLVGLAAMNHARWGILSPLSYGRLESWTLPIVVVGVAGVVVLTLLSLRPVQSALLGHPKPVALAVLGAALIAAVAPPTRPWVLGFASGFEALMIDLRGTAVEFGAGHRRYYWAVMYLGVLKKSMLQSLPWLPFVVVPLIVAARRPGLRWRAALLLLPALAYIPVQSIYERHGGMGASLRYFIPTLPFLALLAAWGVAEVGRVAGVRRSVNGTGDPARGAPGTTEFRSASEANEAPAATAWRSTGQLAGVGAVAAALAWLLVRPAGFEEPTDARLAALDLPLVLAGVGAVLVAWWAAAWWKGRTGRRTAVALAVVFGAAVTWSALLTFDYDARWSRLVRSTNLVRSYELAQVVEPGALVFTSYQDWHGTLPELVDGVVVAFPHGDEYEDFRRLALHHLDTGRPVYAALVDYAWNEVRGRGMLRGLNVRVVARDGAMTVAELRRPGG